VRLIDTVAKSKHNFTVDGGAFSTIAGRAKWYLNCDNKWGILVHHNVLLFQLLFQTVCSMGRNGGFVF
jgi:hypothetical protein